MRILHILDHSIPLHSGYTFRTRAILEQQRTVGWETFHVTSPKHALEAKNTALEETVDGLHFYRTPLPGGMLSRVPVLDHLTIVHALSERLAQIIPQLKPDILHAHSPALNGLAAVKAARRFGLPLVYEIRAFWEDAAVDHGTAREWGLRYRLTRAMETHVIRRADAVTTICEGLRNDIVARGVPADKVTVIPNAVDPERFQLGGEPDRALQQRWGLAGQHVLGFIGSFYAYEGLALLIQALPAIIASITNTKLLLVGGGPQEENMKMLAQQMGLNDKVIFTGRVPNQQVEEYYNLVDVLVYPRLSMRLTELVTPLKPLEAMAQGRLFVASDVGGHKELVQDGVTGRLFKAGDAQALAACVVDMLAHPEQWPRYKSAGRAYVERERNWPASVARYRGIYHSLLDGRKSR